MLIPFSVPVRAVAPCCRCLQTLLRLAPIPSRGPPCWWLLTAGPRFTRPVRGRPCPVGAPCALPCSPGPLAPAAVPAPRLAMVRTLLLTVTTCQVSRRLRRFVVGSVTAIRGALGRCHPAVGVRLTPPDSSRVRMNTHLVPFGVSRRLAPWASLVVSPLLPFRGCHGSYFTADHYHLSTVFSMDRRGSLEGTGREPDKGREGSR